MRSQVLCLTAYLDRGTASRAAYLLAALSEACHYHPYELAPPPPNSSAGSTRPPSS